MGKMEKFEKFFSRGAEAKLFLNSLFGRKVVVKSRDEKKYRIKEMDERIRKKRTKNEAKIVLKASKLINVPRIFCVSGNEIYFEYLSGKLLRDLKKRKKYFFEVGKILAKLHENGICHGDFTPANIMVCKDGIYLIDFGLSSFSEDIEDKAVDFLLMKKSIKKDEFEEFFKGYKSYGLWEKVIERAKEIERRGRYFERKKE